MGSPKDREGILDVFFRMQTRSGGTVCLFLFANKGPDLQSIIVFFCLQLMHIQKFVYCLFIFINKFRFNGGFGTIRWFGTPIKFETSIQGKILFIWGQIFSVAVLVDACFRCWLENYLMALKSCDYCCDLLFGTWLWSLQRPPSLIYIPTHVIRTSLNRYWPIRKRKDLPIQVDRYWFPMLLAKKKG